MPDAPRNSPCPCGSGRKYKNCHGSAGTPAAAPNEPLPHAPHEPPPLENPFKRIFNDDGTVNNKYVLSRLQHLEGLVRSDERFFPIRFDRLALETLLEKHHSIFEGTDEQEKFEAAFRQFAEFTLPDLVTEEFDKKTKETLREAIHDSDLTPRGRAAAACGMVLTLPEDGSPPQPHHENPFMDLVLRVTFNESMARVEFLQKLNAEEEISEAEREVRIQEFLRSVPALLHELQEAFHNHVNRALQSYHRGEYSFGIGVDMVLHGVRTIRQLTEEYEEVPEEDRTEEQNREFSEHFGAELKEAFAKDIGDEEEHEILTRMVAFLETARATKDKKAAKGLSAALEVMDGNLEVRHRMLFAAYHEAVTGSRLFRLPIEEEFARELFADPMHLTPYIAYGECLEAEGYPDRAERIYRAAMEFFPEDEGVRRKLAAVADTLEPERTAAVKEMIKESEAEEEADD